MISKFSSMLS